MTEQQTATLRQAIADYPLEKMADNARELGLDYEQQPQPAERNFCPRCGKRTKDLTTIHTCTPPQD